MKLETQIKEVVIEGRKVEVEMGVIKLENGNVYFKPFVEIDNDNGDYVLEYHEEEMLYFFEAEKDFINSKIEKVKKVALEYFEKKLNDSINVNNIKEHMYENAYDDYVGWGGEYEGGIKNAFEKYLDYITEEVANEYHIFELQND